MQSELVGRNFFKEILILRFELEPLPDLAPGVNGRCLVLVIPRIFGVALGGSVYRRQIENLLTHPRRCFELDSTNLCKCSGGCILEHLISESANEIGVNRFHFTRWKTSQVCPGVMMA